MVALTWARSVIGLAMDLYLCMAGKRAVRARGRSTSLSVDDEKTFDDDHLDV